MKAISDTQLCSISGAGGAIIYLPNGDSHVLNDNTCNALGGFLAAVGAHGGDSDFIPAVDIDVSNCL